MKWRTSCDQHLHLLRLHSCGLKNQLPSAFHRGLSLLPHWPADSFCKPLRSTRDLGFAGSRIPAVLREKSYAFSRRLMFLWTGRIWNTGSHGHEHQTTARPSLNPHLVPFMMQNMLYLKFIEIIFQKVKLKRNTKKYNLM